MSENQTSQKTRIEVRYKVFSGKRSLKPATEAALQRIRYKEGAWTKQESDFGPFAV